MVKELSSRGFKKLVVWARGVDHSVFSNTPKKKLSYKSPIFIYVGRVAIEKNIKTLADFADLSVDEILGGYDEVKGKRVEFEGILQNFDIIKAEAERLIMSAREKVFNK